MTRTAEDQVASSSRASEPLGDFAVRSLLRRLPVAPMVVEVGEFRGHLAAPLKRALPGATVLMAGARSRDLAACRGRLDAEGLEAELLLRFIGPGGFDLDELISDRSLEALDVLCADLTGGRLEPLAASRKALEARRARFVLVASVRQEHHEAASQALRSFGYRIEARRGPDDPGDGSARLLLAARPEEPPEPAPVSGAQGAMADRDRSPEPRPCPAPRDPQPYRGMPAWRLFPGKTLLEAVAHVGLDLRDGPPPADAERGVVVFPYPYMAPPWVQQGFEMLQAAMSDALARRLRSGQVRLVFDSSAEGMEHAPRLVEPIYRGLDGFGVSPGKTVWVTQERNFAADHAAWVRSSCAREPLDVVVYDYWIKRFHDQFGPKGGKRYHARLKAFAARAQLRGKRFVSLNRSVSPTKLLLLLSLLRDGLWDEGYVSFGGLQKRRSAVNTSPRGISPSGDQLAASLLRAPGFEDLAAELAPWLAQLKAKGRISFGLGDADGEGQVQKSPLAPLEREYHDSWFSVITETEMRGRPSRITEKAFKSLVSFHPVLMFANPGALKALRTLGYATFGDVIDERYDEEEDPRRRFEMVYAEVLRLCRMSQEELGRMEWRIRDKLRFNAEWGLCHMADQFRTGADLAVLARILGPVVAP